MTKILTGLILALPLAGCDGEIYLRDGVTDGDTFYLADRALADPDPAMQSWVSYSLTLSACQLQIGGANPARATSFDCELTARRHLIESWSDKRGGSPPAADAYLDALTAVNAAGFLPAYVAHYHARPSWRIPADVDVEGFRAWRGRHLPNHAPMTRLIGSWNYARNVRRVW